MIDKAISVIRKGECQHRKRWDFEIEVSLYWEPPFWGDLDHYEITKMGRSYPKKRKNLMLCCGVE